MEQVSVTATNVVWIEVRDKSGETIRRLSKFLWDNRIFPAIIGAGYSSPTMKAGGYSPEDASRIMNFLTPTDGK